MGDNDRRERRYSDDDRDNDYYYSRTVERYDDDPSRHHHHRTKSTGDDLVRYDDNEVYYSRRESSGDPHRHHHHHHRHHRNSSSSRDNALVSYGPARRYRPRSLSPSAYRSRDRDWDEEHVTYYTRKKPEHSKTKDVAATILGAIVGGNVGKRVGDGGFVSTAAGALVGAWAGHDLEKMYEHHQEKRKDR